MPRLARFGMCLGAVLAVVWGCSSSPSAPGPAPSPSPQPTATRILVGTSMGGRDVKQLIDTLAVFPTAQVLRIYEPRAATTIAANPQFAAAVGYVRAHGGEVWYSFKVDPGSSWSAIVQDWAASGAKIRGDRKSTRLNSSHSS